jgi:hypothetical protein
MKDEKEFLKNIKNELDKISKLTIKDSYNEISNISSNLLKIINEYIKHTGAEDYYNITPKVAKTFKDNLDRIKEYNENLVAIAVISCLKGLFHRKPNGSSNINISIDLYIKVLTQNKNYTDEDKAKITKIASILMTNLWYVLQNNNNR